MKLTPDQYKGLIIHFLTFVGGCLITLGYIDTTALESMLGGIMTLVGLVMSYVNKKKEESNENDAP